MSLLTTPHPPDADPPQPAGEKPPVLVTGATGFVGGKLAPRLLERGYRVRCLVRSVERLRQHPWFERVEVVTGDIATCPTLVQALEGVSVAYYLVHNMAHGKDYTRTESEAAENFASAAHYAGVRRIVYLGGLADPDGHIGAHMRSRLRTGEILREGQVPVTEFRASLIIGAGSVSFEMIRFMTELLPVVVGPPWVRYRSQPISIRNILDYLLSEVEANYNENRVYEIGGTDVLRYGDVMKTYAEVRGLRRPLITLPVLPVKLMAAVIDRVTPVSYNLAAPLLDGMQSDSVVRDPSGGELFPHVRRDSYREAVQAALDDLSPEKLETGLQRCDSHAKIKQAGFFIDRRCLQVDAPAGTLFQVISNLGGANGWLFADWLWALRGGLDRLVGGPGMRGRPETLQTGDLVDFYRVERLEPGSRLLLKAELKAPGEGWMEWRVEPLQENQSRLVQYAYFAPRGFWGFLYWYLLSPFHQWVFAGLSRAIGSQTATLKQSNKSVKEGNQ